MKRAGLVFLLIITSFVNAIGCLNDLMLKDHTIISGDNSYGVSAGWDGIPTGHRFIEQRFPLALKRLDSLWKVTHDVDYYSDYALVLILQGKYEDAKKRYLEIEKIKPGRYETASNLGTVYELLGDNNNALKWIKKAIKINPASHYNSEWLHVKILEAKINDDAFITSDFLLNTNFGGDTIPVSRLSEDELRHLKAALVYQLNERMTFIKPQNKIMAQLLFDLGNVLTFIDENKENAFEVYEIAKQYGYSGVLLEVRMNHFKPSENDSAKQSNNDPVVQESANILQICAPEPDYTLFYILGVCTSILSIGIFFFLKWRKK